MDLGERIKKVRGGMSGVEFCKKLGIHRNTLIAYESGKTSPNADFIMKLHREFGVSITWLLTGDEPMLVDPAVTPKTNKEASTGSVCSFPDSKSNEYLRDITKLWPDLPLSTRHKVWADVCSNSLFKHVVERITVLEIRAGLQPDRRKQQTSIDFPDRRKKIVGNGTD